MTDLSKPGGFQLPPLLASDQCCKAINQLTQTLAQDNQEKISNVLVNLIDTAALTALPHLAKQFNVIGDAGWSLAESDDAKRRLIKQAVNLHRFKGTRWAIENVLKVLDLSGRVDEWFEYSGNPYYFKLRIQLTHRNLDASAFDQLIVLIDAYKNARSHLEQVVITSSNHSQVPVVAVGILSAEWITIYPKSEV